jgi:hypothetical protein
LLSCSAAVERAITNSAEVMRCCSAEVERTSAEVKRKILLCCGQIEVLQSKEHNIMAGGSGSS